MQVAAGEQHVEPFRYPAEAVTSDSAPLEWPEWTDPSQPVTAHHTGQQVPASSDHAITHAEFDKRLAEENGRSFEAGRERGRQEGLQTEREVHASSLKSIDDRQRIQHAELIKIFAEERDRYLQAVEQEVVKLALAVAARILRREAQMDPLLLTGAVRVALGQLSASTELRLRVPSADLKLWTDAIALIPNLALKPVLLAGEGMRLGDCILETSMGSVDLGVRSQLGEIERGFFDRAASAVAVATPNHPTDPGVNQ